MTAITAPTTQWAALHAALQARRPVCVTYHGHTRLICPHALGYHHHRPIVLGYQTGGHTSTGTLPADPRKRWRSFYIDDIDHIVAADPSSPWQTANNYNPTQPFPHPIDHLTTTITS